MSTLRYIEELMARRAKAAEAFFEADLEIEKWFIKNAAYASARDAFNNASNDLIEKFRMAVSQKESLIQAENQSGVDVKLPHGLGSISKDPHTEGVLQYRNVIHIAEDQKKRVCVCARSVEECLRLMQIKEAELKSTYLAEHAGSGNNPSAIHYADLNTECLHLSLGEGVKRFLTEYKSKSVQPRTLDRHEATADNQICKYAISQIITCGITSEIIQAHLDKISENYSHSVVRKTKDLLSMYFEFVYENDPRNNPMTTVKMPASAEEKKKNAAVTQVSAGKILNDEQIKLFKKTIDRKYEDDTPGAYRFGYLFYFLITSFLRVTEALALTWDDIDFENRQIQITKRLVPEKARRIQDLNKTNYVIKPLESEKLIRTISLTSEAVWALKKQRMQIEYKDSDPLFLSVNGLIAREANLLRALSVIMHDAGLDIDGFGMQDLRQTGIEQCIRHGVPITLISQQAGYDVARAYNKRPHPSDTGDEYLKIMDAD